MIKYTMPELLLLKEELMLSLTAEQSVILQTLMDAVIANVEEIKDIANLQKSECLDIVNKLESQINKLEGAMDHMTETLRSLGINIVN